MTALLIATRNAHKAREIRQVLTGDFQFFTLLDFPAAPDAVEDGATFAANASKKALVLADWLAASVGRDSVEASNPAPSPAGRARLRRAVESSSIPLAAGPGLEAVHSFYVLADDSGLEVDALGGAPGVHSARFAAMDTRNSPDASARRPYQGHSARFAAMDTRGPVNSPDTANNAKLLRLLAGVPLARRTARFRCVLALRKLSQPMVGWAVHCPPHDRGAGLVPPPMADGGQGTARPTSAGPDTFLFEGVCDGHISLQPAGAGGFGYDPLFIPDGFDKSFAELGDAVKNTLSHRARALQKLLQYLTLK